MSVTDNENRITRSSGRSASTALPGPSTSIELLPPPIAEIMEPPADPTSHSDLPQDTFTLPVDTELQDLLTSSERRFPPGTPLNDRLRFLVDLHLQVCDLDYAQLPENVMALNSNFLSLFSTARQQTLALLVVQVEARIARLRSSIAVQSVPLATPTLSPPSSQSGMYKRLNSLKNYPLITTGDVFWLDLQRHADANGLTTLPERLAHFHQAIVTDRPLMTWFENTIKPRILTISLEELQDLFFIQTLSPYWLSARLIKLCQVTYRESELLRSFNSRFSSAVINGKFDVNSISESSAWLRSLYLALLPLCVRTKIPVEQINSSTSLLELMSKVAHFHHEPVPHFTWQHPACQRKANCPGILTCSHCTGNQPPKPVSRQRSATPAVPSNPLDSNLKRQRTNYSDPKSKPPGADWSWCNNH
jgi:hypothetical protein